MRFTKTTILILASILSAASAQAQNKTLPLLKTKQSLDNIRFISSDGKFTYYQRRSGDLQVSTNYSNEVVLEGAKFAEYSISSSEAKLKLVVERDNDFHTNLSHLKLNDIYTVEFGGSKANLIAKGRSPKLHQKDQFLSYYIPEEKSLMLRNLSLDKKPLKIRLLNPVNDFFSPKVFMPTPNDIIYTDINQNGHEAFLMRSIFDQKTQTVYKSAYPGSKLEACLIDDALYIGEFQRGSSPGGSRILKMPLYGNEAFKNFTILYQSDQADLGNMVCQRETGKGDGKIYFIKTVALQKELNLKETEIASLSLKETSGNTKIEILTNLERITQLIQMDSMILAVLRGKYYIVKGKANLADDSIGAREAK